MRGWSYNLSNLHILLVEHNPHTRKLIRLILNAFRCRNVHEAEDGAGALRHFEDGFRPDVIIVNSKLPMITGLEVVRCVRRARLGADPFTPVIMVTADTDKHHILAARDTGAHEVLALPLSAKRLYERIVALIVSPRPFVRCPVYFGPDRRRQKADAHFPYDGPERRKSEPEALVG